MEPEVFPPPHMLPTTEDILEELQEVTIQYTNVLDPIERATRQQRVINGEERGLMAETSANIVAAAMENHYNTSPQPIMC